MFDALSEIDSKFAKIADKECDAVTGEVRKWFKKLAVRAIKTTTCTLAYRGCLQKEEKAHDDRMAAVNARIKAAGVWFTSACMPMFLTTCTGASYEKKAKKNTYDAGDEHTRYINLLTSLGPELTQEK